jgi:hypothetical protein
MNERELYSITEARERLGGISRNGIYALLRRGELASVVLGYRRFLSRDATAPSSRREGSARKRTLSRHPC